MDRQIEIYREDIRRIAARHGVQGVRVFGSMVRGEAGTDSDVDLLIETGPDTSPWFPAGFILELEDLLQRRVDVVTERALDPSLRAQVLREARSV